MRAGALMRRKARAAEGRGKKRERGGKKGRDDSEKKKGGVFGSPPSRAMRGVAGDDARHGPP